MHPSAMRCWAGKENRRPSIRIAASIAVFALVWYVSLRTAAASRGAINVAAKAVFLILTCLACIVIGFFVPMVPGVSAIIGSAFWAGLLASGGALAGMAVSDGISRADRAARSRRVSLTEADGSRRKDATAPLTGARRGVLAPERTMPSKVGDTRSDGFLT
jgi:CHASE2 domain-containing sensor protein